MNVRSAFLRLVFFAAATTVTVIGCGAPGSMRSELPPSASGVAPPGAAADQEAQLEQTVAQSHLTGGGKADYGVIDGGWYAPDPAPGQPGYYIIDGEVVPGPPDDSPPAGELAPQSATASGPVPAATPNCTTFVGTVPPPCTATGPFRRVFSAPGNSFALAHLTLPAKITTMPPGKTPLNGDTGFVYFEGWTDANPNAGNSEFGFQYSATNNWYTPYFRTNNPVAYEVLGSAPKVPIHYLPSTQLTFALAGYTIGGQSYLHIAVIGTTVGTCVAAGSKTPTHLCLGHLHTPDAGWTPSACCILARMTTIGQKAANKFYDGVSFGPITWSGVELAPTAPAPAPGSTTLPLTGKEPPWTSAGSQNWPPELNKVVVAGVTSTGETDTIDLQKLPPLSLALNPATCQTVTNAGSVSYTAKLSGNPGSLTLKYGFILFNTDSRFIQETLSVPGGVPYPADPFELVSSGTAAKVVIKGPGPNKPGNWATGLAAYLLFRDATGTLTDEPDVGSVQADIMFGSAPRCPKT
jgi:hypothetical protein